MSGAPPVGKVTTIFTGLCGQACALAEVTAIVDAAATKREVRAHRAGWEDVERIPVS
jgi:hypothetical protein